MAHSGDVAAVILSFPCFGQGRRPSSEPGRNQAQSPNTDGHEVRANRDRPIRDGRPAPVHTQMSCCVSRRGGRACMNALVGVSHRDSRARNRYRAGRLHVSSCNGLPKMWYPVAYMGDTHRLRRSPYRLTTSDEDGPLVSMVSSMSRQTHPEHARTPCFGGATLCRKTMD